MQFFELASLMDTPCQEIAVTLGELFVCSTVKDFIRIRTPYLYPDGDVIDIFLQKKDNQITLTDLGETLRWLKTQTITQKKTDKQSALIQDICLTLGIEIYRGMLILRVGDRETLGSAITRISQAAIRVSDLWFTFKGRAYESITEEVAEFLHELRIPFTPNEKIKGRSGRTWYIDFHTRHVRATGFMNVLSTGSRAAANSKVNGIVASWHDLNHLKVGRERVNFISLLDDSLDIWSTENIRLLEDLSEVSYWSRREQLVELVAPAVQAEMN